MSELPKKILIVRLGALGDVVNALVLAEAIKRVAPATRIGWAVHGLSLPVIEGNPVVDRAHLWDKRRGLAGARACLAEVREEGYDLAIDLGRIFKSALFARLCGAPRVLGFDRQRTKEFAWLFLKESIAPIPPLPVRHMVEQYMEFATYLGLAGPARHSLPIDSAAQSWAEGLLRLMGAAPIAIGVGASYASKRWPAQRFLDLARQAHARFQLPVVLLGGPGDRESARRELEALDAEENAGILDLVGKTSIAELIAMTGKARAFVSCDTGPMHLAVARGRRVVALFGPGLAGRTGPFNPPQVYDAGARHRIVRVPPACAPCNKRTCRMERHDCMLDITVERVLTALGKQVEATSPTGDDL